MIGRTEEVAREVFLELWRTTSTYDVTRGGARSWLVMVARRRAVDRVRAAQSAQVRDDLHAAQDGSSTTPDPAEQVELRLTAQHVHRAMKRLRREHSELLLLTYFGDLPSGTSSFRGAPPSSTVRISRGDRAGRTNPSRVRRRRGVGT